MIVTIPKHLLASAPTFPFIGQDFWAIGGTSRVAFSLDQRQHPVVKVEIDGKGVIIELSSSAFYKLGSAEIRDEAVPVLEKI